MMIFDAVDASKVRYTNDGYLVAEALVARTGIQLYTAGELGMDGDANRVVRVYRPPEEVFATDAMASYAHRPVTVDHPPVMVDASNWKEYSKGQTGDEVLRDGECVRVPMMLCDKAAIDEVAAGKRQFSMGYEMTLEVVDGETEAGEQYDAVQRNLRMNHLAVVSRARGGSKLSLGDNNQEDDHMGDATKLQTVMVDGLSVETTDAGAQAIAKLTKSLDEVTQAKDEQAETHRAELKAKDTELAGKDAEIEALKTKVLTDDALDARVKERGDLIAKAKMIADKDYTGLSETDIRKTAVSATLGSDAISGKSDDYISARFDILIEDAEQDPVRQVLRGGDNHKATSVDKAHAQMVSDVSNAWKAKEVA